MFWSTKRSMIVVGYIHAFETMSTNVNNPQTYYENMNFVRILIFGNSGLY